MNSNKKIILWLPLIVAAAIAGGIWAGFYLGRHNIASSPGREKLADILTIIHEEYVDDIDADSIIELTIPSLIKNLDPHSAYISADKLESANRELESSFFGIGIRFQVMADTVCVAEVISGGPSEKAGLQPGDRIIAVDGENVTGLTDLSETILNKLRGDKGTKVKVTVTRSSSRKPLVYEITRDVIPTTSIDAAYIMADSTGYVRVSRFTQSTYPEFLQALNRLRLKDVNGYIIDLRGNTGGFMEPAVLMANEFLPAGRTIVETRGRKSVDNSTVVSDGTGSFVDIPLVVLIDEFSASSSEIFTGAIQDNDRGTIVGRRSFGKGLVQRPINLSDSSQLRLTVQRYYTPSGRCIQKEYTRGENNEYEDEVIQRYNRGEVFSADSIKFDPSLKFKTIGGRTVYGGGGIMPDVFVPTDTTGVTSYYINVANAGLLQKFAYEYADLNRNQLSKCKTVNELIRLLPSNEVLLSSFVRYAAQNRIAPRWYYINNSAKLILKQLKALIARDVIGMDAYYEIFNAGEPVIDEARRQLKQQSNSRING